jgi:hypothetical protein
VAKGVGPEFKPQYCKKKEKKRKNKLVIVEHSCNPSYLEGRDRRISV